MENYPVSISDSLLYEADTQAEPMALWEVVEEFSLQSLSSIKSELVGLQSEQKL